jgi:arylsulfatase/arylsulfatase A
MAGRTTHETRVHKRIRSAVVVICDDLAWGDLGCHGNPHVHTRHLDRLHADARRFTNYRSGPLCTPARTELFTGRYHLRTGAIDTFLGRSVLRPGWTTLAEAMGSSVTCGLFGKWHLGDHAGVRPHERGFETAVWHGAGGIGQPGDEPGNSYFSPTVRVNDESRPSEGYCTDVFTDEAVKFIRGRSGERFLAVVAFNAPHSPLQVPEAWVEPYRRRGLPETWARVYAMVDNIDANVGRLREAAGDEALFVFTSDHGPCGSASVDGEPRWNGGLLGIKGSMYEGSLKVPCLARCPSLGWTGGEDDDRLAGPIDWMPTLCDAFAQIEPAVDGASLLGPKDPGCTRAYQWHRGNRPIRGRNFCVVHDGHKLVGRQPDLPVELYELPDERHDLATRDPQRAADLLSAYDRWFDDVTADPSVYEAWPIRIGDAREPVVRLSHQDWRVGDEMPSRWGIDNPGSWALEVVVAGSYEFVIRLAADPLASTTFRIGETVRTLPGCKAVSDHQLVLDLEPGVTDLEVWQEVSGEKLGVEQVCVRTLVPGERRG